VDVTEDQGRDPERNDEVTFGAACWDMTVRKFGAKTQQDYIRQVATLAKFLGRSPDTVTADNVRRFQVDMTENGARPSTRNSASSALLFFFATTLDRPELAHHLPACTIRNLYRASTGRGRPCSRSGARGPGRKYKAALSIACGEGLRAGEIVMLRVNDIDSKPMLIRVCRARSLPLTCKNLSRIIRCCWISERCSR
jgi:integrase/recombinase XerD